MTRQEHSVKNVFEDTIIMDRPSYPVQNVLSATFHNQGNSVVRIDEHILLPDDILVFTGSDGYPFFFRVRINFLGLYPFNRAIATYPQLYDTNRLALFTTGMVSGAKSNYNSDQVFGTVSCQVIRSNVAMIDNFVAGGSGGSTVFNSGLFVPGYTEVGPGTYTQSAGAYEVRVYNIGLSPITVNGESLSPGGELPFKMEFNKTTNRQDFVPEVQTIVPATDGARAAIFVKRPSS